MGMRIRHRVTYTPPGAAAAHHAEDMPVSIWNWLKDGDNQRTLAFIGAGIGGVVALLVQTGVIGKKETAPAPAAAVTPAAAPPAAPQSAPPPTAPPATPNTQTVTATSGGTAIGIQGNGNTVSTPTGKH